jgi:hypothetical protein
MDSDIIPSLLDLESFGDVAAEDEQLLIQYFLKTDAVSKIQNNKVFLVLGRKGSGKTALVRFFTEGSEPFISKSLSLKNYPWAIHALRIDKGSSLGEAYVSSWRYIISLELALLVLSQPIDISNPKVIQFKKFLTENYGGISPEIGNLIRPSLLCLSGTFEPEILGCKLGSISLERRDGNLDLGHELNALSEILLNTVIEIAQSEKLPPLMLHFDELDRGLTTLNESLSLMLIGLILAAREVRGATLKGPITINPVIYLRTDIWNDLQFSDKNKITDTTTLNIEWTHKSLLDLINKRISVKLSPKAATWDTISGPELMRGSQTKWNHIISRTFLRPRDAIKFLNSALKEAKKRSDHPLKFSNNDIIAARDEYSTYLKKELDDEIIAHWPKWDEALQSLSGLGYTNFRRDEFIREYSRRKSTSNPILPEEALRLLYQFSVIGYERRSGFGGTSWLFQYTNPEAGWDNTASRFKVHLGLKEVAKLHEERLG